MMLNAKIKDLKQGKQPSSTVSLDSPWLIKKCVVPCDSLLVPQGAVRVKEI